MGCQDLPGDSWALFSPLPPLYCSGYVLLRTVRMTWRSFSPVPIEDHSVNIYVGNLTFTASEDDVRQLFEPYGTVDKVNLITDRETGRARGFGFVDMADDRAAQSAIQGLNGKDLGGRALTVNEAKPREPRRESRPRW
jgi:RNA recognition motif-containing protein